MFSRLGDIISFFNDIISIVEGYHKYCRLDTISTLEDVQFCGGISSVLWGRPSILWRIFSTIEGDHQYCGGCSVLLGYTIYTVEDNHYFKGRLQGLIVSLSSTPQKFPRVVLKAFKIFIGLQGNRNHSLT